MPLSNDLYQAKKMGDAIEPEMIAKAEEMERFLLLVAYWYDLPDGNPFTPDMRETIDALLK